MEFSKTLKNQLSEFLLTQLGSKVTNGITYSLLLKDSDRQLIEKFMLIREEANKCGYDSDQVFRVFEVVNGYAFDMDLGTAKGILNTLCRKMINQQGLKGTYFDILNTAPTGNKTKEAKLLANTIINEYKKGNDKISVALFSTNESNRIAITCRYNGEKHILNYKAFNLTHWDLGVVNSNYLIPNGLKISSVKPCEVLVSRTGISFILNIVRV